MKQEYFHIMTISENLVLGFYENLVLGFNENLVLRFYDNLVVLFDWVETMVACFKM